MKQRLIRTREERFPELQRTLGGTRVDFITAVAYAHDARCVARTRTAIARAVTVNQHNPLSRLLELIRRPRAEDSGAHDCDVAGL